MSITKCLKTAAKVLGAFVFASAFVACVPELPSALDPLGITSKGSSGGGGGSSTQPETTAPEVEVEGEIERVTPDSTVTTPTITVPTALANNATGVNPDADIVVAASAKPSKVEIFESGNDTAIDTINAANETLYSGGSSAVVEINVKDQLIIQQGSVVIVKPHFDLINGYNKLEYNKTYTVKFDGTEVLSFATKENEPTISGNTIKVGSSATADFATIQGALNYLRKNGETGDWTIKVEDGSYHERLYYKGNANVTLVGSEDSGSTAYGDKAIVYWKNNNAWNSSDQRRRANFLWQGGNLTLKNLTFKSTYLRKTDGTSSNDSTEVVYFDSTSNLVAYDCSFLGHQDTLIMGNKGGRAWFYKDFIEGDVDFIWGYIDVALFEECVLHLTGDDGKDTAYIFASRTVETNEINKGYVLLNCLVKVDSEIKNAYYGRNSGSDTQASIINCTFTSAPPAKLWGSAATKNTFEENGDAGVAYKDYGNVLSDGTAVDVSGRLDQTYTMSKRAALREYNGRYAILNRGFDVEKLAYKFGTVWDISAYETEFNATADESNKNVYVEPVFKQNVVGGTTVQLAGDSKASGVTYTYESSDTSVATVDANGLVTAASGVTDWAVITMTGSNGKKDYFQIGVIPEVIPATKVSVSVADASVAKYGLTTATVSFTPANATVQKVKLTSGNTNVKFYDEATKTLVSELTTENSAVRVWVGGDVSGATITAESTEYTSATKGTATVSTKEGEATWCAEAGSYRMNTDIQSGKAGLWDNLIIDSESDNNTLITADGKMSLKSADRMQIKNVTLYIPVEGASTITLNHSSEVSTSDSLYYSIGSDATKKFTADDAKKVFTYTYDGSETGIVLGSDSSIPTSFATSAGSSVNANTKYLKVNAVGGDRYITSIDVKKTGDFTATWDEAPEVQGASGTYNLVLKASSNPTNPDEGTFTANNSAFDYVSTDGFVTVTGLTYHQGNYSYCKNATATIKIGGPSKITWTGAYGGATATFTVTESAGNLTLVDGVKTSWSDSENLSFIYTGTKETTLTLTWGDATAYIKTLVVSSIESTEANTATKIEVTASGANVSSGNPVTMTAELTPKYLNTNDDNSLKGKTVAWSSDATSSATVAATSTVGEIDKATGKYKTTAEVSYGTTDGTATITATLGAEGNASISATSSAVEVQAFANKIVQKTNGDASFSITTTGSGGTIAYSSSDTSVAEINSSSGAVTINKAGYTTITAAIGAVKQTCVLAVAPKADETFTWSTMDFYTYVQGGENAGYNGSVGNFNGLYVNGTNGKFEAVQNGAYIQVNSGCLMYVPVDTAKTTEITVNCTDGDARNYATLVGETTTALATGDNKVSSAKITVTASGEGANVTTLTTETNGIPVGSYVIIKATQASNSANYLGKSQNGTNVGITRTVN